MVLKFPSSRSFRPAQAEHIELEVFGRSRTFHSRWKGGVIRGFDDLSELWQAAVSIIAQASAARAGTGRSRRGAAQCARSPHRM